MEDCDDMNIMNNSDSKEEANIDYEESQLYYPSGIKNKEMWQCIRYVAPSNEKKKWKNEDRIAVYCTQCRVKIKYDAKKNANGITRHMKSKHENLINEFRVKNSSLSEKKHARTTTLDQFYDKTPKVKKMASKPNQEHLHKLVAEWTAKSLRPFSIVEDEKLQEIITFVSSIDGNIQLPTRNTNKKILLN